VRCTSPCGLASEIAAKNKKASREKAASPATPVTFVVAPALPALAARAQSSNSFSAKLSTAKKGCLWIFHAKNLGISILRQTLQTGIAAQARNLANLTWLFMMQSRYNNLISAP
jgi:hypothetical protein